MRALALALAMAGAACAQIFPFPGPIQSAGGGITPPSGFSSVALNTTAGTGNTFTTPTFTVGAGQVVLVGIGATSNYTDNCRTITGITGGPSGTGDTLTLVGEYIYPTIFSVCTELWKIWNPTASTTYSLTIQGNSNSSSAGFTLSVLVFNPGSLTGTLDASCGGGAASATSMSCTVAMTPSASRELAIASTVAADNEWSVGDASTPGFTEGAMSPSSSGHDGSTTLFYYVGNPPAGSITPGFTNAGFGDAVAVGGWLLK